MPLFLKLALGKTEYHYYIEARTQINNQKIVSWTNLYLQWMQDNEGDREALERVPAEVTDIIAAAMEDESTAGETARCGARGRSAQKKKKLARDPIEGTTPREDTPASDGGDRNA